MLSVKCSVTMEPLQGEAMCTVCASVSSLFTPQADNIQDAHEHRIPGDPLCTEVQSDSKQESGTCNGSLTE